MQSATLEKVQKQFLHTTQGTFIVIECKVLFMCCYNACPPIMVIHTFLTQKKKKKMLPSGKCTYASTNRSTVFGLLSCFALTLFLDVVLAQNLGFFF